LYNEQKIYSYREEFVLNPYSECPTFVTKHFTIRLISKEDSESIFKCYNDKAAVELMNDDNCDFGFYVDSQEKMSETIGYWLDFYKKQCFIRFSIVDNATGEAVGTIEGFGGETGVLRVDIASAYEKTSYLSELFIFAKDNFYEIFGNEYLVTKAISNAVERRHALEINGWEYINTFREYQDYYKIKVKI
jgi:RimJ/RimL family protein N-acetyltransferase